MSTTTTDHQEIQKWAESKGGKPAAVDRTHTDDDVGLVRLMFPDSKQSEHQHLVESRGTNFSNSLKSLSWLSSMTRARCSANYTNRPSS